MCSSGSIPTPKHRANTLQLNVWLRNPQQATILTNNCYPSGRPCQGRGNEEEKQRICRQEAKHPRHNLTQGDLVLIRQRKLNKLTPAYDPETFKIQDVKGTLILVERASDGKQLKRNTSHLKKIPGDAKPVTATPSEEFSDVDNTDEDQDSDTPEDIQVVIPEALEKHTDTTTKSRRSIKQPVWMKDYVIS